MQPDQAEAFRAALRDAGVTRYDWFPMIRGRLVAINGKPVGADAFAEDRARRLVEREFNLSHQRELPPHNKVVAGRWRADEADALSVEEGLAQTLGLKLGDRCASTSPGRSREGRITSLRKVDWGSMRVNFFVMFPTATMPEAAGQLHQRVPRARQRRASTTRWRATSRTSPTIDVSASIAQVQRVLDQVMRAVEFLFGFTLAAGLVVLFAAVSATREARAREFAVMRAMGAAARLLAQVQRAELLGVGALAGLLAVGGGDRGGLGAGALCVRVQLDRVAAGAAGRRASPARCWRWPPAGGACARCCAGRWWRRCAAPPTSTGFVRCALVDTWPPAVRFVILSGADDLSAGWIRNPARRYSTP